MQPLHDRGLVEFESRQIRVDQDGYVRRTWWDGRSDLADLQKQTIVVLCARSLFHEQCVLNEDSSI